MSDGDALHDDEGFENGADDVLEEHDDAGLDVGDDPDALGVDGDGEGELDADIEADLHADEYADHDETEAAADGASATASLTESSAEERRRARAARFGTTLESDDNSADRVKKRLERFGVDPTPDAHPEVYAKLQEQRKKQRMERFGITEEATAKPVKGKAAAAKGANTAAISAPEKIAERKARFQDPKVVQEQQEQQRKVQERMARFKAQN
eukprot:TRINITY_DN2379_c0_g1_i1.p1 TRINITY_DN2379_c0_g1~~TRINITY_DN2379_c0_g1_i1.p1  ORF type:complete len:212 (+),score=65.28 TRINITY_DN2379_c0_g1_i1:62-697(+)